MSPSHTVSRSKCVFKPRNLILFLSLLAVTFALVFPLQFEASATSRPLATGASDSGAISASNPGADSAPVVTQAATTIIWRAQDNPRIINGTYVIPAGTKVVMEPGVVVQINADSSIQVDGELVGQGTAARDS